MVGEIGMLRYPFIIFGSGMWATKIDKAPDYKTREGISMKKYLIIPSSILKDKYPAEFPPEKMVYKGIGLWISYPSSWVDDANESDGVIYVDCGYLGEETSRTKRHNILTKELNEKESMNEYLEISNVSLMDSLKKSYGNQAELAKQLADLREILEGRKDEESDEEKNE